MNSSITTISAASFAASSGRLPLVNCSIESRRCLIMVARDCCSSAGVSGPRLSIDLFLSAVLISRSVPVRSGSRAFMAVTICWLIWASSAPARSCFLPKGFQCISRHLAPGADRCFFFFFFFFLKKKKKKIPNSMLPPRNFSRLGCLTNTLQNPLKKRFINSFIASPPCDFSAPSLIKASEVFEP